MRHVSTGDDFIYSSGIIFLVSFLATMEVVALLANDLIMSGTSIRLFRHLELQNPSIIGHFIADSIGRVRRGMGGPQPPQPPLSPSFILLSPLVHSQFILMQ